MLILSPSKSNVISFARSRPPIIYSYTIDNVPVNRVYVVQDFGVMLDVVLTITNHNDSLIFRACKTLGVLKSVAYDFTDPLCLKTLQWNPS